MMTQQQTVLGRKDYGWGVDADVVEVGGDHFAVYGGAYYSPCGMCSPDFSGTKAHFGHVHGGVCFHCHGRGWHKRYESRAKVEALVKRRKADAARRERKEADRLAAQETERAAWAQTNEDVAAVLAAIRAEADESPEAQHRVEQRWGDFLWSLAQQAGWRPLSEAQTAAVLPAVARVAAAETAQAEKRAGARYAAPVKAKISGAGVVAVAMNVDSQYGTSRLVVVEGTGDDAGVTFKTFGTGASLWEVRKGDEVDVAGTVKDHDEYEGVPQTVLIRAKFVVTREADTPSS